MGAHSTDGLVAMSERSRRKLLGAFLTVVWSLPAADSWAGGHHNSLPDREMRSLSLPDRTNPAPLHDPLNKETHAVGNPYAGMSCLQLYVLSMEHRNEAEEKEFSKKDCGSL